MLKIKYRINNKCKSAINLVFQIFYIFIIIHLCKKLFFSTNKTGTT